MASGKYFSYKIALLILLFSCALMLSGCGKSPKAVVIQFARDIYSGNTVGAKKACSENFLKKFGSNLDQSSQFVQQMKNLPGQNGDIMKSLTEDKLECEISGGTARVWDKNYPAVKYILTKEKGLWKVDDLDFDFNQIMNTLKDFASKGK